MARPGYKALVKMSGDGVTATALAVTSLGSNRYQITDATKRVLHPTASVVVSAGTIANVDRLFGIITTTGPVTFTTNVTYLPMSTILEANTYSYSLTANNLVNNPFGNLYTRRTQGQKDVTGSLGHFYQPLDPFFRNVLEDETKMVLEFFSNADLDGPDLRVWCIGANTDISGQFDGLVDESINFESIIDINGRSVSFGV